MDECKVWVGLAVGLGLCGVAGAVIAMRNASASSRSEIAVSQPVWRDQEEEARVWAERQFPGATIRERVRLRGSGHDLIPDVVACFPNGGCMPVESKATGTVRRQHLEQLSRYQEALQGDNDTPPPGVLFVARHTEISSRMQVEMYLRNQALVRRG